MFLNEKFSDSVGQPGGVATGQGYTWITMGYKSRIKPRFAQYAKFMIKSQHNQAWNLLPLLGSLHRFTDLMILTTKLFSK